MRRAQSVRNHMARPSLALAADDLGVLREGDESNEDVLRKQLVERDRECDRLNMTVAALKQQLELRPPAEEIKRLKEEQQSLDVLMLGYQRENEKSMAIIEQYKNREKLLERELNRLAGDNWRSALEIPMSAVPSAALPRTGTLSQRHHRSNTISISSPYSSHSQASSYSPGQGYSPGGASWMGDTTVTGGMSLMGRSRSPSPTLRHKQQRQQRQQQKQQGQHSRQNSVRREDEASDSDHGEDAASHRALREREQRDEAQRAALLAQIEQMRVFILGMEKRLDGREERLGRTLAKAESEGRRYEEAAVAAALKAA